MAKGKFKGSSIKRNNLIEMYGVQDLLNSIEKANGSVDEAVKKAVNNSLELVGYNMQLFIMQHRRTGDTQGSYTLIPASVDSKDGRIVAFTGYEVDSGGLPAIFLDVGTPKQKPNFFRYYAIENNRAEIEKIQRETLNEILKGLK